jgi:hypothetical protein
VSFSEALFLHSCDHSHTLSGTSLKAHFRLCQHRINGLGNVGSSASPHDVNKSKFFSFFVIYTINQPLQVHGMFGITLMSAGIARVIEVCFVAPKLIPELRSEDVDSEHTLAETPTLTVAVAPSLETTNVSPFRHLPPFVRLFPIQFKHHGIDDWQPWLLAFGGRWVTFSAFFPFDCGC